MKNNSPDDDIDPTAQTTRLRILAPELLGKLARARPEPPRGPAHRRADDLNQASEENKPVPGQKDSKR
jgi:hypothetical protein